MSFKLLAEFHGLMALVPAVDGRTADVVAVNGGFAGAGTHQSRLVLDAAAIASCDAGAEPNEYIVVPGGTRMAVWNLSHQELSFHRATDSSLNLPDAYKDSDDSPRAPANVEDASLWVDARWLGCASLAASADGKTHCYVDSDFLQPHTDGHAACGSPTDALVRIDVGVVTVGRPRSIVLRDRVCKFSDNEGDGSASHVRAVSDHFTLSASYADVCVIGLKSFGGGRRYVRVRPSKPGDDLRTVLSALPRLEHAHHAGASGGSNQAIGHFRAYHSLLKDPLHWRIPVIEGEGIASSECPPALARRG